MPINYLPLDKRVTIIAALCEGTAIRAAARVTGVHRDTVMKFGLRVGQGCAKLHDRLFHDLKPKAIEVDEIWSFIHKKQKRLKKGDPSAWGDEYTFIGIDADTKAILSYLVDKRDGPNTAAFAMDLRRRVRGCPQITSDGWEPYVNTVRTAFGPGTDYAMIVKQYQSDCANEAKRRYSPSAVVTADVVIVSGKPDPSHISTSYVERQNLTVRMLMRRFTRLTNAFSKKLENHQAAFALYVAHYNFVRRHETLGTTPAVATSVADHVWSTEELIFHALGELGPEVTARYAENAPVRTQSYDPPPDRPRRRPPKPGSCVREPRLLNWGTNKTRELTQSLT